MKIKKNYNGKGGEKQYKTSASALPLRDKYDDPDTSTTNRESDVSEWMEVSHDVMEANEIVLGNSMNLCNLNQICKRTAQSDRTAAFIMDLGFMDLSMNGLGISQ